MASGKTRLDQLMVARGLAESRSKAQALIMAGEVRVGGEVQLRAALPVPDDAEIEVAAALPYVSRGGYKLAHALDTFSLDPSGLVVLDAGASTGGFSDVLLQRGAARVYAVDVGYGILHWKIRQDARVVVLERTNMRYLEALPAVEEQSAPVLVDCAVIDVSFIALELVLPAIKKLLKPAGWIVALIKPQFEAGADQVGKGGVVRDPAVHRAVLKRVLEASAELGLPAHGLTRSPITGPAGNVEFLVWLQAGDRSLDLDRAIRAATQP